MAADAATTRVLAQLCGKMNLTKKPTKKKVVQVNPRKSNMKL